jgi:hypothetical protein
VLQASQNRAVDLAWFQRPAPPGGRGQLTSLTSPHPFACSWRLLYVRRLLYRSCTVMLVVIGVWLHCGSQPL